MICLLGSFCSFWLVIAIVLILYILLSRPNRWLLDLNPPFLRLPLPNVNDNHYRRVRRVVQCEKLHANTVKCPKSLCIDNEGRFYTGTLDGKVICLHPDGTEEVVAHFPTGRPLGMRITSANILYFIETNTGLYSYDIKNKSLQLLLELNDCKFIDNKPSKFFDDLAVVEDQNGCAQWVYITDVSRKFTLDMWCYTYLEPDNTGRIIRFDVHNHTTAVVLDNLCFPNGIELTDDAGSLLICELAKRRILQHHLKGPKAGQSTVLIENLPGEPENIRRSSNQNCETYWLGLALTRDYHDDLSFLENYSTNPNLRKLILRLCYIFGSALQKLGEFLNNDTWKTKGNQFKTGLALVLSDFLTKPGMALELDINGNVLLSMQVKNDVSVISEIKEMANKSGENVRVLYTGSSGGPMGKIILNH